MEAQEALGIDFYTTLEDLPDEVLVEILSYLTNVELATCVAPVSKRFKDLATTPTLWKSVELLGYRLSGSSEALGILRKMPLLNSLILAGFWDNLKNNRMMNYIATQALILCPNLRTLELQMTGRGSVSKQLMSAMTTYGLSLKTLKLKPARFIPSDDWQDHEFIQRLEHLELVNCNEDILDIVSDNCDKLTTFIVHSSYFEVLPMEKFLARSRRSLKSIQIHGGWTLSVLRSLCQSPHLTELQIYAWGMKGNELKEATNMPTLKSLLIECGYSLTVADFIKVFSNGRLELLEKLEFKNCPDVTDNVLKKVLLTQICGHFYSISSSRLLMSVQGYPSSW